MAEALYTPGSADFAAAEREAGGAQTLARPSLSYWQDAWRRLKANPRAISSLVIVGLLIAFTVLGPVVWTVDPAEQNLEQISQGPGLGIDAVIVERGTRWPGVVLADWPAYPEGAEDGAAGLAAPAAIRTEGTPSTWSIKLVWDPVENAAGYAIYRNTYAPAALNELGLPLGETLTGNAVSWEDQLRLDARTYYYSVVATDGVEESPNFTTIAVDATPSILLDNAISRGLVAADGSDGPGAGDRIRLPAHPLGTDYLGRDMLARLMHGARTSLFIGICAPLLFVAFGTLYGAFAGFVGGRVDQVMMRFADFVVALPFLLFMILIRIAAGIGAGESGIVPMLLAMVVLLWPATARLVRGQILQIREEGYVQAARLLGASDRYLILRHMVPNTLGVILVTLTFAIPSAIFTEAFLSFIGMGVTPPTPSWGSMCYEGIKTMLQHPHELVFPAVFISVAVLAFNLLGDGLRDALDARMRSRE